MDAPLNSLFEEPILGELATEERGHRELFALRFEVSSSLGILLLLQIYKEYGPPFSFLLLRKRL